MRVISRGITAEQEARVGLFRCPACTSLVSLNAYDLVRWSPLRLGSKTKPDIYRVQCPVCGDSIPETAREDAP